MNLNIALIGAGAISELGYIPAILKTEGFCLKALVDIDKKRLAYLKSKFKIEYCTNSFAKIISKINAVIIATPPHTHKKITIKALKAGLNVLCEKPMANSLLECQSMINVAKKVKKTLMIGHVYRFMPNRQYLYSLLEDNLRKIKEINIYQGEKASWETVTGYSFRKELVPGGVLFNEGIHSLDFILWFLGYPDKIKYLDDSLGGLESNCTLTLWCKGKKAYFRLSRTCSLLNTIEIVCKNKTYQLPVYNMNKIIINEKGERNIVKLKDDDFNFVKLLSRQLENFKDSVEGVKKPLIAGEDGLKVIKLIEFCYYLKKKRSLPKKAPILGVLW